MERVGIDENLLSSNMIIAIENLDQLGEAERLQLDVRYQDGGTQSGYSEFLNRYVGRDLQLENFSW